MYDSVELTFVCRTKLSLPIANMHPIVNTLVLHKLGLTLAESKHLLPIAEIHPIASARVRVRTSAQMSELLFVRTEITFQKSSVQN